MQQTVFSSLASLTSPPHEASVEVRQRLATSLSRALKWAGQRTIVCWGTGQMGAEVAAALPGRIRYYVDNDERRHGTTFHDCPVRPPSALSEASPSDLVVLVASMYDAEIRKRLTELLASNDYDVISVSPLHVAAWAVRPAVPTDVSALHIPCPVCEIGTGTGALPYAAREREEDDLFRRLTVCACSSCDSHFAEPRPSPAALASYYAQAYRADGRNVATVVEEFPGDHPWYLSRAVTVAQLVSNALSAVAPPDPLRALEIGAGYGYNLFALRRALSPAPLHITALEPDSACRPTLNQVVDRIVTGDLDSLSAADAESGGPFDIVLLLHVLEHVPHPAAFLTTVHALLRPGGLLALEVPHCPVSLMRGEDPSTTPHVPHLFFFTENGLHSLLRRCNFEIETLATYGPELDWQGDYDRSFTRYPLPVGEAIARGECPPPPFPLFGEAGPNRLFLRALVRVPRLRPRR